MHPALGILLAYALGSIPFAYLAGKAKGVDLRSHGSGNLGATNAARVLGAPTGAAVYALDTMKGFVATFALPTFLGVPRAGTWAVVYAIAVIVGHVRPAFLGFSKGGKGVATAGGAFAGLAWLPTLVAGLAWGVVFLATGYVSAGSLAAAVVLPAAIFALGGLSNPILLGVTAALGALVIWLHRANISRLRSGHEHRFALWGGGGRAR